MSDVSVSRTIAAPADRLFELVSDLPRMGEWSPENDGGTWVSGDGPAVGARFKGANSRESRKWSTMATVTDCTPGERFAFEVKAGPLKVARWEYAFEPADDGTRVTESYTDQRGFVMLRLGALATGVKDRTTYNRAGIEATLEALDAAATS